MPDAGRATANSEPDVGDVIVTVADVLAAQARLRRYLPPTPMHHAERFGVMLKLENLQRTGSYKVRGALNALLAAREREQLRGQPRAALDRAGDAAQALVALFRSDVLQQQLHIARDDLQDVVEVVGDAAGQLADRFHLLRLS